MWCCNMCLSGSIVEHQHIKLGLAPQHIPVSNQPFSLSIISQFIVKTITILLKFTKYFLFLNNGLRFEHKTTVRAMHFKNFINRFKVEHKNVIIRARNYMKDIFPKYEIMMTKYGKNEKITWKYYEATIFVNFPHWASGPMAIAFIAHTDTRVLQIQLLSIPYLK